MTYPIHYQLCPSDPKGHLFTVTIRVKTPNPAGQTLSLPAWIPGSYLIRDFAKHIIQLNVATQKGTPLACLPTSKSTWQIEPTESPIVIHYQVYAWDLSVRGAHFDESHAFFNETSVFMAIHGFENSPSKITLHPTEFTQQQNWQIATTLPKLKVADTGFGDYQIDCYKNLIEYPVEMGNFMSIEFNACGIAHKIALTGHFQRQKIDRQQLINDLTAICEYELNLFGNPYPINEFLFQVMVTAEGYGGLEHLNSTALMCDPTNLPYTFDEQRSDGYLQFLELCSHEYFHTWNVKRIQPKAYQTADLSEPVYTNQLWWFEGITSFYDGLFLYRAGIISQADYLNRLAKEMTRVYRMPGRFKQSVAESSYLTWTKFYQQDENAPNAIISYYTKGSLIALGLDLTLRSVTQNNKSLDDILLYLWEHYGKTKKGLKEGEIEAICSQVSGVPLKHFFEAYLYGTEDLPFENLFAEFGIDFTLRPPISQKDTGGATDDKPLQTVSLGANLSNLPNQTVKITHIWENSTAYQGSLASGDELIAFNGYKISTTETVENFLKTCQPGEKISCHYFRRDALQKTTLNLQAPENDRVSLSLSEFSESPLDWFSK